MKYMRDMTNRLEFSRRTESGRKSIFKDIQTQNFPDYFFKFLQIQKAHPFLIQINKNKPIKRPRQIKLCTIKDKWKNLK